MAALIQNDAASLLSPRAAAQGRRGAAHVGAADARAAVGRWLKRCERGRAGSDRAEAPSCANSSRLFVLLLPLALPLAALLPLLRVPVAAGFVADKTTGVTPTLSSSNNRHVDVAFTAPANTGGSSITAYHVYSIPAGPKDPFTGSSSPITWEGTSAFAAAPPHPRPPFNSTLPHRRG